MLIVWSNSGTSFLWTISLVSVSGYHVHSTKPIISVATSTIDATACVCTQYTPTITVYITLTSYLVWATWWLARELLYIVIYTLNYCHIWLTGGSDSEQHSILHVSQDHKTWSELEYEDSADLIQPSVIRPKAGMKDLMTYVRDRRAEWIYQATSTDDGEQWSKPSKTTLPNNNSGIQATVLQSDNIAIVYNPTHNEWYPRRISLSKDERKMSCRNTIKYVKFKEEWIKGQ